MTDKLPTTTELITIEPTSYVAAVYEPFQKRLDDAITAAKDVTYDIATKAGMEVAKINRALFRDIRIEGEKARAARKAPILEIGKLLDSKYKEIAALVEPHETRFDTDIKAEEKRLDDERAAKIKAEAERQSALQSKIDAIKNAPLSAINMSSEDALGVMGDLELIKPTSDEFGERFVEAEIALNTSVAQLKTMIDGKRAQEVLAEQAEAKAKAVAEAEKIENERIETARREEQERMNAERAELDRQRAEIDRKNQELAERQRIQQEEEAKARAKVEAEAAAKMKADQEEAKKAEAAKTVVEVADKALMIVGGENQHTETMSVQLAQPDPRAVVIEHQAEIREFLDSLDVDDKKKQMIRPYLVEFVKFQADRGLKVAA